ncbi:serine protease [Crocosphaera sp. XPORK-15E]|uniref:S1 family peptidase n=1 Tax=Crocosphaera sp. XPORK-15E TaxID=3110247 RepID=UPI002B20BA2D|nr:serine protease [Crocosphaera sp. XPORK-15E]MEA5534399.1 serine protease [Crocosphaera sp. XPORK-15E]
MNWRLWGLTMCLGSFVIPLPSNTQNFADISPFFNRENLSDTQLYEKGRIITVKLLSDGEHIGSGIIIKQNRNQYLVVTNAHVIRAASSSYQVQTFDNKVYLATEVKTVNFGEDDLGLLQFFAAEKTYAVAKLGKSLSLKEGDKVYAVGFPFSGYNNSHYKTKKIPDIQSDEFAFKSGKVVSILNKALEGGYQVGFNNDVYKGMSGGPLLNQKGEVVAINGRHAQPLWDATEYYEDGSQPSLSLQQIIIHSSWAVPVERMGLISEPNSLDFRAVFWSD